MRCIVVAVLVCWWVLASSRSLGGCGVDLHHQRLLLLCWCGWVLDGLAQSMNSRAVMWVRVGWAYIIAERG